MITLTLHDGSRWAVPVAHITGVRQHARGAVVATADGDGQTVRETFDEVRAMVDAALRPSEAADVAAARQAARLLHRVADVVRDDKNTGFSSGDIGEAMDSCLGIRSATWRETADELDRLAYRLGAP